MEWIYTKDAIPQDECDVLGVVMSTDIRDRKYYNVEKVWMDSKLQWRLADGDSLTPVNVVCWCPIPELPDF